MNNTEIFSEFKKNVQEIYPDAEIHLFSPRAHKIDPDSSNYNVLVILNNVNSVVYENIHKIAWETGSKHNTFFLPVITQIYNHPLYPPHLF